MPSTSRQPRNARSAHVGPVSVVVATHCRPDRLGRLFAALSSQTIGPSQFELVIVDDASGDETPQRLAALAAAAAFPVRIVIRPSNGGPAAAREEGWRLAAHPLVAFTDDDCVPRPEWLAALAATAAPTHVVVGRTVAAPDQECLRGVFSRTIEVDDATYAQTCNVAYPRDLLVALGGFDTRLRTGEDTDLALRARESGAALVFQSAAVVEHDIRPSRWRAAVREAWSWSDLPAVVLKHPQLRSEVLHRRWWWKPTHPPALLAALGVGLAAAQAGRGRAPSALVLVTPWLKIRLAGPMPQVGCRRRLASLPGQLVVDLTEVGAVARGSLKHRSLLL